MPGRGLAQAVRQDLHGPSAGKPLAGHPAGLGHRPRIHPSGHHGGALLLPGSSASGHRSRGSLLAGHECGARAHGASRTPLLGRPPARRPSGRPAGSPGRAFCKGWHGRPRQGQVAGMGHDCRPPGDHKGRACQDGARSLRPANAWTCRPRHPSTGDFARSVVCPLPASGKDPSAKLLLLVPAATSQAA